MKKFFEEYGKFSIAAIVIILLLLMIKPIGAAIQTGIENVPVPEFSLALNNKLSGTKTIIEGSMAKGNIVKIDGKEYRVLEMDDTQAKFLAMYDATQMYYDADNDEITSFNGTNGIQYAGSDIDNYLENEFYSSLSFKDAIIPQNITQNMYEYTHIPAYEREYDLAKIGSVSAGSRHVYLLDVEDVISYLGSSFTPQQLNTMFWNVDYLETSYMPVYCVWLRSADAVDSECAWIGYGDYGYLDLNYCGLPYNRVRPAFVVNLSKVEWFGSE